MYDFGSKDLLTLFSYAEIFSLIHVGGPDTSPPPLPSRSPKLLGRSGWNRWNESLRSKLTFLCNLFFVSHVIQGQIGSKVILRDIAKKGNHSDIFLDIEIKIGMHLKNLVLHHIYSVFYSRKNQHIIFFSFYMPKNSCPKFLKHFFDCSWWMFTEKKKTFTISNVFLMAGAIKMHMRLWKTWSWFGFYS